jgi:ADP-ribosylglycohydrolase
MTAALAHARLSLMGLSVGDSFGHSMMWCAERIAVRMEPPTPWTWSDDTEMAVSIVDTLEEHGRIDQADLARRFTENFHEGRMYGPSMLHEYFPRLKAGESWRVVARSLFGGQGSFGNGGAMRVTPVGAYFADDLEAVVEHARLSAEVTHAHHEAIAGAIAVAVAAAWAHRLRGSPAPREPRELIERVIPLVPASEVREAIAAAARLAANEPLESVVAKLGNGSRVSALDTVPFVLWSAGGSLGDFSKAIWTTVSATGDMDTTAAMVGGIVALFVGETGIPKRWIANREALPAARE